MAVLDFLKGLLVGLPLHRLFLFPAHSLPPVSLGNYQTRLSVIFFIIYNTKTRGLQLPLFYAITYHEPLDMRKK